MISEKFSEGGIVMERADKGLAFLLRYENIAWYEDGKVRILDRRCYPNPVKFVTCNSTEEVVKAIKDMVTQSAGPYLAAGMGMALAAYEARRFAPKAQMEYLEKASDMIANARPTTAKRMKHVTEGCLKVASMALEAGAHDAAETIFRYSIALTGARYEKMAKVAKNLVDQFPDEGTVMTQCFAETVLGFMCKECKERGKKIKFI